MAVRTLLGTPPPPCESNTKIQKFDRNNPQYCSDKGVPRAHSEKRSPLHHKRTSPSRPQSPTPTDKKGRKGMAEQRPTSLKYHPRPQFTGKTSSSGTTRKIPRVQNLQKQVSLFRPCTLCGQNLQKQVSLFRSCTLCGQNLQKQHLLLV